MGWTVVSEETTKVEDSNPGVWLNAAKNSVDKGDYNLASEQIRKANYYDKNGYYKKDFTSVVVPLCEYFLTNSQPSKSISLIYDIFTSDKAHGHPTMEIYFLLTRSYFMYGNYGHVVYYSLLMVFFILTGSIICFVKYIAACHFLIFWPIVAVVNLIIPYNVVTVYSIYAATAVRDIFLRCLCLVDVWTTVRHSAHLSYEIGFQVTGVLIIGSLTTLALLSCRLKLRNNNSFIMWLIWLSLCYFWLMALYHSLV